eukprot:309261-Chlamydomonas_euryale.AAC.4
MELTAPAYGQEGWEGEERCCVDGVKSIDGVKSMDGVRSTAGSKGLRDACQESSTLCRHGEFVWTPWVE